MCGTNLIITITSVKISKVDIADGEELEGATIQLIDKGEVVEEWTSTNKAHEVTGLGSQPERQLHHETVAPEAKMAITYRYNDNFGVKMESYLEDTEKIKVKTTVEVMERNLKEQTYSAHR